MIFPKIDPPIARRCYHVHSNLEFLQLVNHRARYNPQSQVGWRATTFVNPKKPGR